MASTAPVLLVTMGDPAGVGPEIAVQALSEPELRERAVPVFVGSAKTLVAAAEMLNAPVQVRPISDLQEARDFPATVLPVWEPEGVHGEYPRGKVDAQCGEAGYRCIEASIRMTMAGQAAAVVTNPIHKQALHLAGHHYPGHTEIFRDLTGAESSAMMLVEGGLRVSHVSTHVSLRQAIERCKRARILTVLRLTHAALQRVGIESPRLGLAALNPHASEGGLFGDEEEKEILPAAQDARAEGMDVSDPLPADTIFSLARGGRFDAVVAQYHDQGHIPVKLLGFHYNDDTGRWSSVSGINVTLGLPMLRVSVDHGTAFDQAWKGTASPESLRNALDFAIAMTTGTALSR
ncbi:MAG: 4-hydroxythreonine-4-phosphate dehydrogenase PdxA [Armatimonadaceae bacterium]